jgi:hypothetical protein
MDTPPKQENRSEDALAAPVVVADGGATAWCTVMGGLVVLGGALVLCDD